MLTGNFIKSTVLFIFISLTLSGCGGGGGGSTNPYAGTWYNSSFDSYLVINSTDSKAVFRRCSVNDGYPITGEGNIVGDSLVTDTTSYPLSRTENSLTLGLPEEFQNDPDVIHTDNQYSLVTSVPEICVNDAVNITSIEPLTVDKGVATAITVNIEYRLVSSTSGTLDLSFNTNTNDPRSFPFIPESSYNITQGTDIGSLSATIIPVYHSPPYSFQAVVTLFATLNTVANDFKAIAVNQI